MKFLLTLIACMAIAGSVQAHSPLHTHSKAVPDSVKARCWAHAPYPKKCINDWKGEHSYKHRHAHGHSHGHRHGHVHVKAHSHGGKPSIKVGVGVKIPIG